jgi:hypothetical protein
MTLVSKRLDLERLRWPVLGLLATFAVAAVLNATRAVSPEHGLIVLLGVVLVVAWWGGLTRGSPLPSRRWWSLPMPCRP